MSPRSLRTNFLVLLTCAVPAVAHAQSAAQSALTPGVPVSGELDEGDSADNPRNTPADRWSFAATPGDAYSVTLRSDDFDTYLMVLSPEGTVVVQDDDSAGDLNSRAEFRVTAEGRYTVLASSFGGGSFGAYSLVVDEMDPTMVPDPTRALSIEALAFGDTVSGELTMGDASVPSRETQADGYRFSAPAGQRVEVEMTSDVFDCYLSLIGPTGEQVMSDDDGGNGTDARIRYTTTHAGEYTVVATSFGARAMGAYAVSLRDTFVNPIEAATPIELGREYSGTFENGQAHFSIELSAGQQLVAEAMSSDVDTVIDLYNSSEMYLAGDDDGGEGTNSRLRYTAATAGLVRFTARTYSGEGNGAFTFRLSEAEPVAVDPTNLRVGRTVEGELTEDDARSPMSGQIVDVYRLELDPGEIVTLNVDAGFGGGMGEFDMYAPDAQLRVFSPIGEEIYDMAGNSRRRVVSAAIGGSYLVTVGTYIAPSAYTLEVTEGNQGPGWPEPAGGMEFGDMIQGVMDGTRGDHPERGTDLHVYVLELEESTQVDVRLTAEFDAYLEIRDTSWMLLNSNDDSGGALDSHINMQLGAGTYHIVATQFSLASGSYTLSASGGASHTEINLRSLELGATVESIITVDDARSSSGTLAHFYQVDAEAGQQVTLALTAQEMDAYIEVYDAFGELMQLNDDGGEGLNSLVSFTYPRAGRYTIVARDLNGATGPYALTYSEGHDASPQPNYEVYGAYGGYDPYYEEEMIEGIGGFGTGGY